MTTPKSYWDHSEAERAAMAADDVERFLDFELMSQGVLKAPALELVPEPIEPKLTTTRHFKVGDIAFVTQEQAGTFKALQPLKVGRRYIGSDYRHGVDYVEPLKVDAVELCDIATADSIDQHRAVLEQLSAARTENEKRRTAHAKETKAQHEALDGLWLDWHRCRALDTRMRRTVETFEDYKRVAGGDEAVAAKFLLKVFSREQIAEAAEWCGVTIPVPVIDAEFAEAETAPAVDSLPAGE